MQENASHENIFLQYPVLVLRYFLFFSHHQKDPSDKFQIWKTVPAVMEETLSEGRAVSESMLSRWRLKTRLLEAAAEEPEVIYRDRMQDYCRGEDSFPGYISVIAVTTTVGSFLRNFNEWNMLCCSITDIHSID